MPSRALLNHLPALMEDAHSLLVGYRLLRPDGALTNPQLAAFPRGVLLACFSAWEGFLEELVREAVDALQPSTPPGVWSVLRAFAHAQAGNFHTPSAANTDRLLLQCLGLPSAQAVWRGQNNTSTQAARRLGDSLTDRHEVSHGILPRPVVDAAFAADLPRFITRLAQRTDAAVRQHFVDAHGVALPWPA